MLKTVDLPQPEGPISETSSPCATLKETRSTAVMGPSGVSKRLTRSSTRSTGAAAGVTEAGLSCSWLVVADAGIRAPCTAVNRRIV